MHGKNCGCARCGAKTESGFEAEPFRYEAESAYETEGEYPMSEAEEVELAMELMSVSSEAELDQFLGKFLKKAWQGVKKVAKPFAGALKGLAKKALPFVGGALGSLIPIPGVGTAVGSALGGALSKALELETQGLELEDQEFEMARRFVRIASTAVQNVASAPEGMSDEAVVNEALTSATRQHVPGLKYGSGTGAPGGSIQGKWLRRGRHILVLNV